MSDRHQDTKAQPCSLKVRWLWGQPGLRCDYNEPTALFAQLLAPSSPASFMISLVSIVNILSVNHLHENPHPKNPTYHSGQAANKEERLSRGAGMWIPDEYRGCPGGYQVAWGVKNPPANAGAPRDVWVQSLSWKDPLEEETATYSSILAWRTPWAEEPGRL